MNTIKRIVVICLLFGFPVYVQAAGETITTKDQSATLAKPLYKPPLRGAPAGRVGGGTRGVTERESFSLLALAPDHVGYTTVDQPCLYWFISKPTSHPVELTVTERSSVKPLLEKEVKGPEKNGMQAFCLAEHEVRLRPGVTYKWFVTLVTDAEHRSKDILAGGMLELVGPSTSLIARLKAVDGSQAAFVYAEEGYWYDSLAAITKLIESTKDNAELLKQRAALLEQVGLTEAVAIETH